VLVLTHATIPQLPCGSPDGMLAFIMLNELIQRASTSLQLMQQIAMILPFSFRQDSLDYTKLGI
jgi:hypothetical protein